MSHRLKDVSIRLPVAFQVIDLPEESPIQFDIIIGRNIFLKLREVYDIWRSHCILEGPEEEVTGPCLTQSAHMAHFLAMMSEKGTIFRK